MTSLKDFGYEDVKVIGRGQYGKAHLVRNSERTSLIAKTIDLQCLSAKERDASQQEVALLSRLNHPNIVEYKANFCMGETLVIIMQYCEGGDLGTYIKDMLRNKMRIQQVQIMNYLVQVLQALQYIHGERILHRDLKSSNLFLMKSMSVVKLGDFGISRVLEGTAEAAMTVVGTPYYMSPEVCENKPYTYKSDVWSLGCVLYELCMLKHAFSADNLLGLVYKIVRNEYEPIPKLYSQELNRLIKGMLDKNAETRPSVRDLLADPYVQGYMNEYVRTRGQCATPAAAGSARATPVADAGSAGAGSAGVAVERLPTAAAASSQSGRGGPRPVRRSQQRLIAAGAVPRRPPRQQNAVSTGAGGTGIKFETPKEAMARRRREAADKQAAQLQAAAKQALQNKSVARDMKQKQFHATSSGGLTSGSASGNAATVASETSRTYEDDDRPEEVPDETSQHDDGDFEYDSYTEDVYEDEFEDESCSDDGAGESEFEEDDEDETQVGGAYLREEQDAQRVFKNYEQHLARATALPDASASPPFKRNSSTEQTPRTVQSTAASSAAADVGPCLNLQSRAARLREDLIGRMGEETFQKAFDFIFDARSRNMSFSRKDMETVVGKELYPCCFDVDQLVYQKLCCS